MAIIDSIKERAKQVVKTIVLPEGMDRRTWEAAVEATKQGLAKVIVLANPDEVKVNSEGLDLAGITVIDPATAEKFGLADKQIISIKVDSGKGRALVFGDVVCRVSPKFAPAVHIDTDDSNAACAFGTVYGEIIK